MANKNKDLPKVGQPDAVIAKQRPIRQADILALREEQGIEPKAGALDKPKPVDHPVVEVPVVTEVSPVMATAVQALDIPEDSFPPLTDESLETVGTPPVADDVATVTELIQELNDNGGNYRFEAKLGEDGQHTFNVWSSKLLILVGATVDSIKTDL